MRVEVNGIWVADSTRAIILHETRAPPMHYFPTTAVRMDCLERTEHQTHCPFKGVSGKHELFGLAPAGPA